MKEIKIECNCVFTSGNLKDNTITRREFWIYLPRTQEDMEKVPQQWPQVKVIVDRDDNPEAFDRLVEIAKRLEDSSSEEIYV